MSTRIPSFLTFAVVIAASLAASVACVGADTVAFSISGRIRVSTPPVETYPFELDVVGSTWYLRLHAPDDVAHLLYNGVNQQVISFPLQPRSTLSAYVHNSQIPHGGSHFQTLWFGFCRHVWTLIPSNDFINLQTFSHPPIRTNALLRINSQGDGIWRSVAVQFPHNSKIYPIEEFVFNSWTNVGGAFIPLSFSRLIHSRLGVEYISGAPNRPSTHEPPDNFASVIEQHDVLVESVSVRSAEELRMKSTDGLGLDVVDQRFGAYGNWVSYRSTNRFRDIEEVRSDQTLAGQIKTAQRGVAGQPHVLQPNRFVVMFILGITTTIFAALAVRALTKRRRTNNKMNI